jgi:hypothetical protein
MSVVSTIRTCKRVRVLALLNRRVHGDHFCAGTRRALARRLNGERLGAFISGLRSICVRGRVESLQRPVCWSGLCKMLVLFTTPSILMGNRHVPPEATLKWPVELMPQLDSVPEAGHSEAARAGESPQTRNRNDECQSNNS